MFYSEKLKSPISEYNVKRLYGVNPTNDPVSARKIGIYPLDLPTAGYTASHYRLEGLRYKAVDNCVSEAERNLVGVVTSVQSTLGQLRVALGLPENPEVAQSISGHFPLYNSQAEANAIGNGSSTTYTFNATDYYMPNGVTQFTGDHPG